MSCVGKLICVSPDWPVSANVNVLTTTRHGGVSAPPFEALNLGLHVGDERAAVIENRRRLREQYSLPNEPVWLTQTHSVDMLNVDAKPETEPDNNTKQSDGSRDADGAFTCLPNNVLAVLTADCLPVVISDKHGTQLAAVHAGWRGLAGGILSQAISRFEKGAQLYAWLGPAIGPSKFEVGEEVFDAFVKRSADNSNHFRAHDAPGKYWADLYALARTELAHAGCETFGGEYCTHTNDDLFHSHRRDGKASGRMATVAWISKA